MRCCYGKPTALAALSMHPYASVPKRHTSLYSSMADSPWPQPQCHAVRFYSRLQSRNKQQFFFWLTLGSHDFSPQEQLFFQLKMVNNINHSRCCVAYGRSTNNAFEHQVRLRLDGGRAASQRTFTVVPVHTDCPSLLCTRFSSPQAIPVVGNTCDRSSIL